MPVMKKLKPHQILRLLENALPVSYTDPDGTVGEVELITGVGAALLVTTATGWQRKLALEELVLCPQRFGEGG